MAMRSVSSTTITFGMIAIPVKVYLACSAETVSFNQLTADGHRVRQKLVDEITGEEVARDSLAKGHEYARGQFVAFTADELKRLEVEGERTVAIEKVVPSEAVDLIQAEKSYYLGPDKGGDRAYRLLAQTLEATGRTAIAQWGTRGREHLVAIRAARGGLVMHTLFYADEVRDAGEIFGGVAPATYSDRELAMARSLLDTMTEATFELGAYRDRYRERVLEAVQAKVQGREIVVPVAPVAPIVVDLFEALKRSLAEAQGKGAAPAHEPQVPEAPQAPQAKAPKARKGKKAAA